MNEENSTAFSLTHWPEGTSDIFYATPKQTKQQKITTAQLLQVTKERRGEECHTFIEAYGDTITQAIQQVAPTLSSRAIIRKLEHYFATSTQRTYTGRQLTDEIVRTIDDLRDDFVRLRALKQLQSEKQKHLHELYDKQRKGIPQISYSQSDVLDRCSLIKQNDAQRLEKKMTDFVHATPIQEWFHIHTENAQTITERNQKLLTLSDLPPLVLHDFWHHQLVELITADQLADEGNQMSHCVGGSGTRDQVKAGKLKVRSVRTADGKSQYTIWYTPQTKQIVQRKWYSNQNLVNKQQKNFPQMCAILGRLKTTYPITTVADWNGVCDQQKEVLRSNGTVSVAGDMRTMIKKHLAGQTLLLGAQWPLLLPAATTLTELQQLCKIPHITLDLTDISQTCKDQITHIAGSLKDTTTQSLSYALLTQIGGFAELYDAPQVDLPKLEHIGDQVYLKATTLSPSAKGVSQIETLPIPGALRQYQLALRTKRPDERLPDGNSFRDACDSLLQEPAFLRFWVDEHGDSYTEFVETKVQCRHNYLRTESMKQGEYEGGKNDYKQYTDNYLLPSITSTRSKDCIYKNTIDQQKSAWKQQLDNDCYAKWYVRQTKAYTDKILQSLANKLNITYNAASTSDQQIIKAYMYLKGALGREWLNNEYDTNKEWDKYWQLNKNSISGRSIVYCHVDDQRFLWSSIGDYDCSIPLMRWW